MIVGVTGKAGVGKESVCDFLVDHGFIHINIDRVGHSALNQCQDSIVAQFSKDILAPNGEINRSKLGTIVFSDSQKLYALEAIVHPWMRSEIIRQINSNDSKQKYVLNGTMLAKLDLVEVCNQIIVVKSHFWHRLIRCYRRDHRSWLFIFKRFIRQINISLHPYSQNADIVHITNNGSRQQLKNKLEKLEIIF